jgi:Uma2 family endonuclease
MTAAHPDDSHQVDSTLVPFDLDRLYSVEEYLGLSEDKTFRYELQDGVLIVSPRPAWNHQVVSGELYLQLRPQLHPELAIAQDIDVDLEFSTPTVRAPDLVVIRAEARDQEILKASDVMLAVEIISPGSIRMDTKTKLLEYDEAGIPNYWVVDPRPPIVTATVYRLYEHGYEESQRAEHTFEVDDPCPLRIDLDALLLPAD